MSTSRAFAYNTGAEIPGTQQFGDLAVGTPTNGFDSTGLQWWNGPDEQLGYVIAYPVPSGDHPTPISGVTAFLGFLGTKNMINPLSESTFVELTNSSFNQSFINGNDASIWLTNEGYWNSWVSITPTPTATLGLTPTPTPTPSVTPTITPTTSITPTPTGTPAETPVETPTPTPTPTSGATTDGWLFYYQEGPLNVGPPENDGNTLFMYVLASVGTYNPNYTGGTLDLFFNTGTTLGTSYLTQFQELDTNGGTLTISQASNTVIYSGSPAQYNIEPIAGFLVLQVTNESQMIQSASTAFVSGVTINVVVS